MRHFRWLSVVALAAACIGAGPGPSFPLDAESAVESASARQDENGLFNIAYEGGNVRDYLVAVRKASPGANIVVDEGARDVPIGPVELKAVDLWAAVYLVHEMRSDHEGVQRTLQVEVVTGEGGNQIYRVQAYNAGRSQSTPAQTRVWTVADLKSSGIEAEHILTAIETAVGMQQDLGKPEIKYHDGASLVIARGHPAQIETIDQVIGAMTRGRSGSDDGDGRLRDVTSELERMVARVDALETELARARSQVDSLERALADTRAENEAMRREIDRGQGGDR